MSTNTTPEICAYCGEHGVNESKVRYAVGHLSAGETRLITGWLATLPEAVAEMPSDSRNYVIITDDAASAAIRTREGYRDIRFEARGLREGKNVVRERFGRGLSQFWP